MKKAAKQSVERHSFPATRLWKITAGPERPIAAPIKRCTVTAQWETDPPENTCACALRGCRDNVRFLARKLAASQAASCSQEMRGRKKKGEFNMQRKSREFDGGCKRRLERRMRGRLNTRVKHGRALQPSLHHLIIFPVYIHKATLCLFSLSLSHGLTFLTTWSFQTFLDCKRQNLGWFIGRDISESVQKKGRNQTTKRESWEVRDAIKHEREMKNRHTRRGQRRYL